MATLLYAIGRFSYRHSWQIVVGWFLILAAVLGGGIALGGSTSETFTIPGTESQQTIDKLAAVFPAAAGASAQVVFQVPEGQSVTDAADQTAITAVTDAIATIPHVTSVITPYSEYAANAIAPDKTIAYATVQFDGPTSSISDATVNEVIATRSLASDAGVRVEFGGDIFQQTGAAVSPSEGLGVLFAAIVLFFTFGSLLAAGLPLLSALLGVGISVGAVIAVSAFATVSSTAPLLAVMIGLAVGIDYALFILSRHRTQLAQGMEVEESAAQSVATAGSAVVFAGTTVIIALLGLLVVGIPFLSVMGVAAAVAVFLSVCIAATLLPAIMGMAKLRLKPKKGSRVERRAIAALEHEDDGPSGRETNSEGSAAAAKPPVTALASTGAEAASGSGSGSGSRQAKRDAKATRNSAKPVGRSMGARWVGIVMKAPIVFIIAVVGLVGVAAIPAFSLDLNLPNSGQQAADTTNRQAYDLIAEGFGSGYNGPLIVVADITQSTDIKGVLTKIGDELRTANGVVYVSQGIPDSTLDTAIFRVIPDQAPDSPETKVVVQDIRNLNSTLQKDLNVSIAVTGQTAVAIDISNLLAAALLPFGILVVGLSIVLLAMVFRSIAVPLSAAAGFLLSVGASFGVSVAVFQWGWGAELLNVHTTGPLLSFLPILMMAILFGLAMDYQVFLVSGMREEYVKTGDARRSVRVGFVHGARVVTAAALIMFFVFFAFVPEGTGAIKQIALALAVGVFVDAFLVRMTLVPAVMTLLGDSAWKLPKGLARLLPNVDVEGEGLRDHIASREWASPHAADAITAENLRIDGVERPITVSVPRGSTLVVLGDTTSRRLFGATLAGRIKPLSGDVQVQARTLPSEAGAVSRRVSLVDLSSTRPDAETTVSSALRERLSIARPWYRPFVSVDAIDDRIDSINRALRAVGSERQIGGSTALGELTPLGSSLVLTSLGLADGSGVLVVDAGDTGSPIDDAREFLDALTALVPEGQTLVLGLPTALASPASAALEHHAEHPAHADPAGADARPVVVLHLLQPAQQEGSLR
ncbi:MMPL family transporter [Subtercola frigoramans]|uniref:RND superfamily putative drug exporter n=1 Tax=Subtercola frigoramans TaxID=120298 RepID=A0ABS2L945_9MICO|nr:MMPL family transporter [Subtercola frigoramans]MBM7473509.1 RND superfamily putative drug exporter [Subtercola frigoramans]